MDEPSYFQNALSGFTTEAACGGAVRHLVDSGYTLDQIVSRLDYPASRAKVQRIMMDYLYESHILLKKEPSGELFASQSQLVQEQDAYGRRSFRKISIDYNGQKYMTSEPVLTVLSQREKAAQTQESLWTQLEYEPKRDGKLTELLYRKCKENGEIYSYVSCSFGKAINDQRGQNEQNAAGTVAEERISCLNSRQREYLQGIRWEQPVLYHRLNRRMLEIVSKLYEEGVYDGVCYFLSGWEKITIPAR